MGRYKALNGVRLHPCCIKTIKSINQRIKNSNILQVGAPVGILVQMFFGPPKSEIATLYSISTTDWGLLAEFVKGVCAAVNRKNAEEALNEAVIHQSGDLGAFWDRVYEIFDTQ